MENASKAIMIAGGVLIAIIIISLGMYIWGVGTGAFGSAEQKRAAALREEQMVKFSQYVGLVYGSEVENCIRKVVTFNELNGTFIKVTIRDDSADVEPDQTIVSAYDVFGTNDPLVYVLSETDRNDIYKGELILKDNGDLEEVKFVLHTAN